MPRVDDMTAETITANVLMVDDHPPNLVALEAVLEPLGCRLGSASSRSDALRRLLRDEFAVILLDALMPDLHRVRNAALLQQREPTRLVPITFITANHT